MDAMENIGSATRTPQYPMSSLPSRQEHKGPVYHPEFDLTPAPGIQRGPSVPDCLAKAVIMEYGPHRLHGILFMLATLEYMEYHSRFFGIMPSIRPQLSDPTCEPWVLLNGPLGKTWVHGQQLPESERDGLEPTQTGDTKMLDLSTAIRDAAAKEPPFIAITDNLELFRSTNDQHPIGRCDESGAFAHSNIELANDLIVALPCRQSFAGTTSRPTFKRIHTPIPLEIHEYPPLPICQSLLDLIHKIQAASANHDTSHQGVVRKKWIKDNIGQQHFDSRGHLSPKSPLFAHRGNEAVFYREVWSGLCFPLNYDEERCSKHGFQLLPKAYFQGLFVDLSSPYQSNGLVGS